MKTTTRGSMPDLDLGPVLALVPALWGEWDGLRFAPDGAVVDPLTGATRPELRLTAGTHGRPGASYLVTVPPSAPVDGPGPEGGASTIAAIPTEVAAVVTSDDGRTLDLALSGSHGGWTAEVEVARGPIPRVEVTARADLRALLRAEGQSGCVAGLVGSRLRVTAMAVAGGWIRRAIDRETRKLWDAAGEGEADRRAEVEALAAEVAAAGGPGPFVRRAIWDPTFEPTMLAATRHHAETSASSESPTALTKRSRTEGASRSSER